MVTKCHRVGMFASTHGILSSQLLQQEAMPGQFDFDFTAWATNRGQRIRDTTQGGWDIALTICGGLCDVESQNESTASFPLIEVIESSVPRESAPTTRTLASISPTISSLQICAFFWEL